MPRRNARISRGFTLVELLVVITIIGILIALLLPAVQAAREAARLAQCRNNIKQLALGCMTHEGLTNRFPSDGWGYAWTGDADLGNDWRQPGGWLYNILPFIEQQALHDLGTGLGWNASGNISQTKMAAHVQRVSTPVATFYCPTRRRAVAYPWVLWWQPVNFSGIGGKTVGRSDYAVNGGESKTACSIGPNYGYPAPWGEASPGFGDAGPPNILNVVDSHGQMTSAARATIKRLETVSTGASYTCSQVRLSDITDGASNTYLTGEKYLNPDAYTTGTDNADNETALSGHDDDIARWASLSVPTNDPSTWLVPLPDTAGYASYCFGSAHVSGFNMAFCDGSVHAMNYSMAFETHRRLCNRRDGLAVDGKSI
jgi:prepilin-type N-terminal cleavage/methylation domain-containing protein/prepilin-type processing-associated H-X9-DG protein